MEKINKNDIIKFLIENENDNNPYLMKKPEKKYRVWILDNDNEAQVFSNWMSKSSCEVFASLHFYPDKELYQQKVVISSVDSKEELMDKYVT